MLWDYGDGNEWRHWASTCFERKTNMEDEFQGEQAEGRILKNSDYRAVTMNELDLQVTTWINLKNIMLIKFTHCIILFI